MESSQVYWLVLCLLPFTQAVVPQVADRGVASDNDAVPNDNSPAVQYLRQLFQRLKESNRFQNGEINLLPDETKGFATTVHCFQAQNNDPPQDKEDIHEEENKRTLQFDFSSLSPSQDILATQLVFLVPETNFNYVLSLYEVEKNGDVMGPLDSKLTSASIPHKGWLEFTIQYTIEHTSNSPTKETFTVSITDQSGSPDVDPGSLFDSIMPLLVVYTYDNTSIRPLVGEQQKPKQEFPSVQKRDLTLQDMENKECQRHSKFLTYEQIGWPRAFVIQPSGGLHYAYCYGKCSNPFDRATKHSQLLAAVNTYHRQRNNHPPFPPPCCVPIGFTPIDLITVAADGHIMGEIFENVTRCGCV